MNQNKTKELFDLVKNLNEANEQQTAYYIEICKILYTIKKNKLYMHYASHIKNWVDFLKEIGITYSESITMINTCELMDSVDSDKIYKLPINRLKQLVNMKLNNEETIEEMLEKALTLPIKDWNDEVKLSEGLQSYITCDHSETEEFLHCKQCGKWIKI